MPVHSVVVEVVQDGQAVLGGTTLLQLAVVRLGLSDAAVLGPVVLVAHRRRGQLLQLGGPEPAVHHDRLQVRPVAALEVTEPAAGPDVFLLRERGGERRETVSCLKIEKEKKIWK